MNKHEFWSMVEQGEFRSISWENESGDTGVIRGIVLQSSGKKDDHVTIMSGTDSWKWPTMVAYEFIKAVV